MLLFFIFNLNILKSPANWDEDCKKLRTAVPETSMVISELE